MEARARIPLRFRKLGKRYVPTVDLQVRMQEGTGLFQGSALVDTGSSFTVFSRVDLRVHRFPVANAQEYAQGIGGIGGRVRAFYLPEAIVSLRDADNALHSVNVQRLFLTDAPLPPIFGRELLKLFNAVLTIDFNQESGSIAIG